MRRVVFNYFIEDEWEFKNEQRGISNFVKKDLYMSIFLVPKLKKKEKDIYNLKISCTIPDKGLKLPFFRGFIETTIEFETIQKCLIKSNQL